MTTKTVSYYLVPVAAVIATEELPARSTTETDKTRIWLEGKQPQFSQIDRVEPEPDQDVSAELQLVLIERAELAEKVEKLDHFLHVASAEACNDKARGKLWQQLSAMRDYLKILDDRIADYEH